MRVQKYALVAASATLLALGLAMPAHAGPDASVLAGSCANCHGTDGRSPGAIPSIAGIPYEALLAQLQAFREGTIPGVTVMTRIARGYSDEELEAIAQYFAQIAP